MPRNGKKIPRNGFFYFMEDWREAKAREGFNYDRKTASERCSNSWAQLPQRIKDEWTQMAKANSGVDDATQKFTSLGVSFAQLDAEQREIQEFKDIMKNTIKNTISKLDNQSTLKTHNFYLCHVNYFYKIDDSNLRPAEIALVEFSLERGLTNELHIFVTPGEIPLGLRFEAKDWSERTHGIPLRNFDRGENDFYRMFLRVFNFLTKNKTQPLPPIYSMPDSLNNNYCLTAVRSAMAALAGANEKEPSFFKVYELPLMFYELRNKACEYDPDNVMPSIAMVENEIEKDVFATCQNLGCNFHEEMDLALQCSLSIIKRWVFTICDHCCKFVGVDVQGGKHTGYEVNTEWKTDAKASSSMPPDEEDEDDSEWTVAQPRNGPGASSRNGPGSSSRHGPGSSSRNEPGSSSRNGPGGFSRNGARIGSSRNAPGGSRNDSPPKNKGFMPTAINHNKLKELRKAEKENFEQQMLKDSSVRPPRPKFIDSDDDETEVTSCDERPSNPTATRFRPTGNSENPWNTQPSSSSASYNRAVSGDGIPPALNSQEYPSLGGGRGRGMGMMFPKVPPVTGRGRLLSQTAQRQ